MQKNLLLLFFISLSVSLSGQQGLEAEWISGRVLKHKEGLFFEIPSFSYAAGVRYYKQTDGTQAWHHYWGLPQWEGSANYLNFGNKEILGRAISLAPGMAFNLKKWKKLGLYLHYGTGIAYLNKPFDVLTNPKNNAIGSHLNNTTKLRLALRGTLKKKFDVSVGFSFYHYSNGLTSSPNSGINVYGLHLGFRKTETQRDTLKAAAEYSFENLNYRKWGLNIQAGMGMTEFPVAGGPEYPIYAISFGATYRYTDFQRLHFGVEHEYSVATFEFEKANFVTNDIARHNARRNIVYVANELMFGPVFFKTQAGYYLPLKSGYSGESIYFKIQTSFRPKFLKYRGMQAMLGTQLKTHYFVAEYIAAFVGIDF